MVDEIVSGDSYRSQHAPTLHFGLGAKEEVGLVTIRFADGTVVHRQNLSADRYYEVSLVEQRVLISDTE